MKEKLIELGAEVTEINSIKIEDISINLDEYKESLESYDHIIFTSTNGVNKFFDYLVRNKYDIRKIKANFFVIGSSTKKALEDRGIQAHLTAKEFFSESLIEDLKNNVSKGQKVLIPGSAKSRTLLKEELEAFGLFVDKVDIYDTVCGRLLNERSFEEVDVVFYTSPSTVYNMIKMLGIDKIKEKKSIAIGPQTKKALEENNIKASMCPKHSEEGFLEEILKIIYEAK